MGAYHLITPDQLTEEMQKESKKKLPIIWISALECTGCVESFIQSKSPGVGDALLQFISLEYSELLSVASGFQIEQHKTAIFEEYQGEYVLVVEGAIPSKDEFLMIVGKSVREEIIHAAKHAKAVLAFGSCSAWGGIPAAKPNPTDSVALPELISDEVPLALIPGCPPIAEVMLETLLYIHFHGELPELDKKLRPKAFYSETVHMTCHRKPFFDQKLFAESYDDEGAKKGYCLLKLGCKGPSTFNACETVGWNNEKCSPIRAGFACIGCSEKDFWEKGFCGKKRK